MARATYPYEWELGEGAFTLELIQIYDVRDAEQQSALDWGMTSPSDAPPIEPDPDDSTSSRWSGLGDLSGWILGIGIVLILWWAFTRTGVTKSAKTKPSKLPEPERFKWGGLDG